MASTTTASKRVPHPSEGANLKLSIGVVNPNDFLDKLKPKGPPRIDQQSIFDGAMRVMYRQGGPAIRVAVDTGTKKPVTFSTRGGVFLVSPLLSLLTAEDVRRLQKATSYERLQRIQVWGLPPKGAQDIEDQATIKTYLEDRGIFKEDWPFLQTLELKHYEWATKCLLLDDYGEKNKGHILSTLYDTMSQFAGTFSLTRGALDLFRPK